MTRRHTAEVCLELRGCRGLAANARRGLFPQVIRMRILHRRTSLRTYFPFRNDIADSEDFNSDHYASFVTFFHSSVAFYITIVVYERKLMFNVSKSYFKIAKTGEKFENAAGSHNQ